MNKAVPIHCRPRRESKTNPLPEWVGKYQSHLRKERRERRRWRQHVIRLDCGLIDLIGNDRKLPLDILNHLDERNEPDE
jgi:hypothetical protein